MEAERDYRAVLAVDIERSAGRGNVALDRIREVLGTALRESFAASGIDWEACLRDDLGDGMRVTAPPRLPKTRLIHPLVHELAVRLRAHNRTAGEATRVRVRIALHAGDVRIGPTGGVTGQPLEVLARLLEAAPARTALAQAPETVSASLLVSGHIYDEAVRHGYPGIDPDTFRKVTFTEKEHTADAWLHLPGYGAAPPLPAPSATETPARPPARDGAAADAGPDDRDRPDRSGRSTMVNNAYGHGVVYALQHGTQHIRTTREP